MTTAAPRRIRRRLRRRPPSAQRTLFYTTPALQPGREIIMSNNILTDKAMLVALNVTGWSASAQDKDAAAEVAENHQADPEVGRYTKRLLPKEAMQEVNALGREIRASHEDLTLPWTERLYRLLPVASYEKYQEVIDQLAEERVQARSRLIANLPDYIARAKQELGDLFEPGLYPSPEQLKELIAVERSFMPIPDGNHFVADLAQAEVDKIRRQIDRQNEARLESAMSHLYQQLGRQIGQCLKQLTPPEGEERSPAVRAASLENLRKLSRLIPAKNLTDDPELNRVCKELQAALEGVDAKNLQPSSREYDAAARDKLSAQLEAMNRRFAGAYGDPPPKPETS